MDKIRIRKLFADFAGPDKFYRFMFKLNRNAACREGELFLWQEKLWESFLKTHQIEKMEQAEILDIFTYCHRHNEELVPGIPDNINNYFKQLSKKYPRETHRRLAAKYFPYAAYAEPVSDPVFGGQKPGKTWHCPACCKEVQAYIEKTHHKKILLEDYEKYVCDMEEDIYEHYISMFFADFVLT